MCQPSSSHRIFISFPFLSGSITAILGIYPGRPWPSRDGRKKSTVTPAFNLRSRPWRPLRGFLEHGFQVDADQVNLPTPKWRRGSVSRRRLRPPIRLASGSRGVGADRQDVPGRPSRHLCQKRCGARTREFRSTLPHLHRKWRSHTRGHQSGPGKPFPSKGRSRG